MHQTFIFVEFDAQNSALGLDGLMMARKRLPSLEKFNSTEHLIIIIKKLFWWIILNMRLCKGSAGLWKAIPELSMESVEGKCVSFAELDIGLHSLEVPSWLKT